MLFLDFLAAERIARVESISFKERSRKKGKKLAWSSSVTIYRIIIQNKAFLAQKTSFTEVEKLNKVLTVKLLLEYCF